MLLFRNIPVKLKLTYLGVIICNNEKQRSQFNFEPIIEKTKNKFNLWLMRDISIFGRVLLSKAEGISRSVYTSLSLDVPPKIINLDQILYNFIGERKPHYLKKEVICNPEEQGDRL